MEFDAEGSFVVPDIAPGRYFLEMVLPSGRVHLTDPLDLPDRETLRRNYQIDDSLADERHDIGGGHRLDERLLHRFPGRGPVPLVGGGQG